MFPTDIHCLKACHEAFMRLSEEMDLRATVPRILKVDFSFARFLLTEDAE